MALPKFSPFLTDEATISPATPGDALVRLSQTIGVLKGENANANDVPNLLSRLASARDALLQALENPDSQRAPAFFDAQKALRELCANLLETEGDLARFGFADPHRGEENWVQPVDLKTLCVSHFKPARQVFSSFSFDEAVGATAYRLHEIRYLHGERLDDDLVLNFAPRFSRVRIPVGTHHFVIESHDANQCAYSEEFTIEIPQL